jgi:L-histidine Nalpha-methyltransferase
MAVAVLAPTAISEFAADVREGLSRPQKSVPSKYLYDDLGTALFEAICLLPEYGVTRAETRILEAHADSIAAALPQDLIVAELGSGTGKKTRILLEAISKRKHAGAPLYEQTYYHPIEISLAALQRCEMELRDLQGIRCGGVQREYLTGLREVALQRAPGQQLCVLFLGSSIGNFDEEEGVQFVSQLRAELRSGDALLLAADLVKPVDKLLAAYDDPTGVTAAFDLNVLGRINRELQGDFDLVRFAHNALYNHRTHSVEMHLRSLADQTAHIQQLGLRVRVCEGETIWTESSHKYSLGELQSLAVEAGFEIAGQWIEEEWGFAENLWVVK